MGRRLSRLSDETNEVLTVAAVVGIDFDSLLLERAGGLPEQMLLARIALEQNWTSDRDVVVGLSGAAVAMARRVGDPSTLADVLLSSFMSSTLHRLSASGWNRPMSSWPWRNLGDHED